MGFIFDGHIKEHIESKTIQSVEYDGSKTWLQFSDGTALRVYCNYGLNSRDGAYYPYGEIICTPYGSDGKVAMMK